MWLPFGLHKIEKPGQGMRARWFSFIALMLLAIWGCQSCYRIMHVSFDWQAEVPDPSFGYDVPHPCPEPGTLRSYGISLEDWTMVVVKTAAERVEGEALQTRGGIPVENVQITFNTGNELGRLLQERIIRELRVERGESVDEPTGTEGDGDGTGAQTQPQTGTISGRLTDDQLLRATPWQKLATMLADGPRRFDDAPVLVSGPGTGIRIDVTNPLPDQAGMLNIDNRIQYIVPAGVGTCPETGQQLDGMGIPWAAVTVIVAGLLLLLVVWKVCFGSWASTMLIETDQELNKVHWPTWERVYNSSVIVVITTMVFAVLLFGADLLLNQVLRGWLHLW